MPTRPIAAAVSLTRRYRGRVPTRASRRAEYYHSRRLPAVPHENGYAKALETLGVDWKKLLPIPKTNAEKFPEVKALVDQGLQSVQYTFDLKGQSEAGRIFQGLSPSKDGTDLSITKQAPEGVPSTIAEERFEEYAPGLDPELLELIQATAALELADIDAAFGPTAK